MLRIAAWEHIFGSGSPEYWAGVIENLLERGATLQGKEEK